MSWVLRCIYLTSKHALFIRSRAGPEKMPCVRIAYILVAPDSINLFAAITIVPHVSAMSSTNIATLSWDQNNFINWNIFVIRHQPWHHPPAPFCPLHWPSSFLYESEQTPLRVCLLWPSLSWLPRRQDWLWSSSSTRWYSPWSTSAPRALRTDYQPGYQRILEFDWKQDQSVGQLINNHSASDDW